MSTRTFVLKCLAPVLVLIPSLVVAQPSAAPPVNAPAPERFDNDCTHLYPPAAAAAGAQGTTVVSVHIATDGAVQNPQIAESSGNADLDKAALTCVTGQRVHSIMSNGAPVQADTQMQVVWQRSYFSGAPAVRGQVGCLAYYPPIAVRLNHQGDVALSFTIDENGMPKNVTVTKSSGFAELDQASIDCVSKFLYRPVTQNGHPITIDSLTAVKWRLRG